MFRLNIYVESSIPPTLTSICYVRLVLYCLRKAGQWPRQGFQDLEADAAGFSLISKSAAFYSGQMPLSWVVPLRLNVFGCLSACQGVFFFSFSISHTIFFCFQDLGFLSFPSQRPSPPVTRCPCFGWSHHSSMCLPVCLLVKVSFFFPFLAPFFPLFSGFWCLHFQMWGGNLHLNLCCLLLRVPLPFLFTTLFVALLGSISIKLNFLEAHAETFGWSLSHLVPVWWELLEAVR